MIRTRSGMEWKIGIFGSHNIPSVYSVYKHFLGK